MSKCGVVIIGRNEGQRLRRCLASVGAGGWDVVYVDSGSTDGSSDLARSMGAVVVDLDTSIPFSAARARNEGFQRMMREHCDVKYMQFVDGDCEVMSSWIQRGIAELDARNDVAVVCGRMRERFPEASVYNRLCDLEWNTQVGEVSECGGIAMYRAEWFREVGGFNPAVVAGEEPELCLRLRRKGWKVIRLADDMAWHDAEMLRFGQWWKRSVRSGQAYAQGAGVHGKSADRYCVRQCRGFWFWGLIVPVLALGAAWWTHGVSLVLLVGYPLLAVRIYRYVRRRGWSGQDAWLYAFFTVLGKWPQLIGMMRYHRSCWRGAGPTLIEYKGASSAAGAPGSGQ